MDRLLINCDLGEDESDGQTARLLSMVDAASVCCGVHAGSESKTKRTLEMLRETQVMAGVHPGLAIDGGRGTNLPDPSEFQRAVKEQILRFILLADDFEVWVDYVKLHGSLYSAVESDGDYADAYIELLLSLPYELSIFSLAGGSFERRARAEGLKVWSEGFFDRGYMREGSLVPRSETGAVLSTESAVLRFQKWKSSGLMDTVDGSPIALHAQTFCVHSDSPDSETLLAGLREIVTA